MPHHTLSKESQKQSEKGMDVKEAATEFIQDTEAVAGLSLLEADKAANAYEITDISTFNFTNNNLPEIILNTTATRIPTPDPLR